MNHLLQTNKFHRIVFRKVYVTKIKPQNQTIRNLLTYYLTIACQKYPNEDLFNMYLSNLYDIKVASSLSTYGTYSVISIALSAVDPKYINDENYTHQDILECFNNCLKPVIIDDNFDKKLFKKAKDYYLSNLLYNQEQEAKNALKSAISTMFEGTIRDFSNEGTIEELKKITVKRLYNYYKKVLKEETVTYVVGDILDYYKADNNYTLTPKSNYLFKKRAQYPNYVEVKADTSQAYLNILYDIKIFSTDKLYFPAAFLNYHFGGSANSKLFQIVREKYGLCYSIASAFYGASGIILVSVVMNKSDKDKVIESINEAYDSLLDDFDLDAIKKEFFIEKKESADYITTLVNEHFYSNYFKKYLLSEEELQVISNVTMKDIKKVYKMIKPSLIHIYGGDDSE